MCILSFFQKYLAAGIAGFQIVLETLQVFPWAAYFTLARIAEHSRPKLSIRQRPNNNNNNNNNNNKKET